MNGSIVYSPRPRRPHGFVSLGERDTMKTHLEDGILNLNQPSINKEVLSILQVLDPSFRPNDIRYYSSHSQIDRRWSLFVRGKKFLTYDRHHGQ